MRKLIIDEQMAKALYPFADGLFKSKLHEVFGEDFFSRIVVTFEDACRVAGYDPYSEGFKYGSASDDLVAYKRLRVWVEAFNDGWTPDWGDKNEPKFYPRFYLDAPGFRFGSVECYFHTSSVGSRLCFRSLELAEYAMNVAFEDYKKFFTSNS